MENRHVLWTRHSTIIVDKTLNIWTGFFPHQGSCNLYERIMKKRTTHQKPETFGGVYRHLDQTYISISIKLMKTDKLKGY